MLITYEELLDILQKHDINITGVLHVGSHECEELDLYSKLQVIPDKIIWIDALLTKVLESIDKGIPNVYSAVITDQDDVDVQFNVSNNIQSSSVLPFKTHLVEHPWVHYTESKKMKSVTIDTFAYRYGIDMSTINMWNMDIQGAELMALKGGLKSLKHVKLLYLEVNEKELYEGCALLPEVDNFLKGQGFERVMIRMTEWGW